MMLLAFLFIIGIIDRKYDSIKHFLREGKTWLIALLILATLAFAGYDSMAGIIVPPLITWLPLLFYHLPGLGLAITANYFYFYHEYIPIKGKNAHYLLGKNLDRLIVLFLFIENIFSATVAFRDIYNNIFWMISGSIIGGVLFFMIMIFTEFNGFFNKTEQTSA